jgi:mannose-6-phosphate isomerase
MDIVKLNPAIKSYIWGGKKLVSWGKKTTLESISECWELSFNADGPCEIATGKDAGKALKDVVSAADLGANASRFAQFPVLIKLIDSADNLSIQVHPSDDYALKNEGQYGKTEMWYIIEAEPHAGLYVGFKKATSAEEVRGAIADGSIMDLLNFREVKPGESYFIPSGTVHAIGKGVTLLEIQQNSTLTYRLYDYGRLDKNGQPRQLHVEKGLKVLNYQPYNPPKFVAPVLGSCQYFASSVHHAKGNLEVGAQPNSFVSLTFVGEEEGTFAGVSYKKGDTFFVPAGKKGLLKGPATYVETEVPQL